jgi:chromosome segregation ATPase
LVQNEALRKEQATLTSAKTDIEKRLNARETETAALIKARDEQTKLAAERKETLDRMERTIAEQAPRLQQLEAQLAESNQRQQLLHEEMIKAEAQIDLIKDVLLREPGI